MKTFISILGIFVFIASLFLADCQAGPYAYAQDYFQKETNADAQDARKGVKLPYIDKEAEYDIYYEVSAYEVHRIENIRIIDVIGINGVPFLVVSYSGYAERVGYIKLASIQAILPMRAPKPARSGDILKKYQ